MISVTSGRIGIADTFLRVFPAHRDWARRTLSEIDQPVPSGPWPTDALTFRSESIVEFRTPPRAEGLGTDSTFLKKNNLPIDGAAILIYDSPGIVDAPDLLLLATRLPPKLQKLAPVIVTDAEREATTPAKGARR